MDGGAADEVGPQTPPQVGSFSKTFAAVSLLSGVPGLRAPAGWLNIDVDARSQWDL